MIHTIGFRKIDDIDDEFVVCLHHAEIADRDISLDEKKIASKSLGMNYIHNSSGETSACCCDECCDLLIKAGVIIPRSWARA